MEKLIGATPDGRDRMEFNHITMEEATVRRAEAQQRQGPEQPTGDSGSTLDRASGADEAVREGEENDD